jgi:hypothetical protein
MKQTAVEWFHKQTWKLKMQKEHKEITEGDFAVDYFAFFEHAKEMEEKKLLEMLHKFGFDYTYNYKGEKTIYEWIPEWFQEYKRLEQFKKK